MADHHLETMLGHARGVLGRYPEPDDRYIFTFDAPRERLIHMVGVRRPLRVRWLVDGHCLADEVLQPWTGWGRHRADTIIETQP